MKNKWIWEPSADFASRTNVYRFMQSLGYSDREEFLAFSSQNPEAFWDAMVKQLGIEWFEPYQKVLDLSGGVEWSRWFVNGKLNIAWNCLDRHARGPGANIAAVIWEGEDGASRTLNFSELYSLTNQLAHGLASLNLKKGDRVALYMPVVPEVVAILYACFKLGLVVVPIFAGFGPGAAATRINDSGARVLFTADYLERRGKLIPLKEKADQAAEKAGGVQSIVVLRYKGGEIPWTPGRDIWWDDLTKDRPSQFDSAHLDSEDTALILYTSGTTGQPKGAVHTHAGALAQTTKEIYLAFDYRPGERFFWVTDIGWMMGPWQILGVHHFGGTIFLYDGAPDYPQANRFWRMIEQYRVNIFGISPTAIRLLMRPSADLPAAHDLTSLRILGSTGEPWDETSYLWYFENIGRRRCPVINISGGTEIIGCFLTPLPIQPLKPCSLGSPAPGIATEAFSEAGLPVRGQTGYLVCTKPAPSLTRGLWNAPERYIETYWSRWKGVWNHGDLVFVDEDGCWFIEGRADDAFNVAGRKIGPAEIEEALVEHPLVSEAAVIGVPDEFTGESIVAFLVAKPGAELSGEALDAVATLVTASLGSALRPRSMHVVPELPKTQSGKIVRRAIRRAYLGEDLGDLSTVENPGSIELISSTSKPTAKKI